MKTIKLTTRYREGGMQMRHVFDELKDQGLKPNIRYYKEHDEITFAVSEADETFKEAEKEINQKMNALDTSISGNLELYNGMAEALKIFKHHMRKENV